MYTDGRLWSSLPKGAQVWFCGSMDPGGGLIETLGFKTKYLLVHEVHVSCFKYLETSRGFFSAFFLGVVSIGVWTNNLTRKDLWTSHVASWNLVEEALESILGKAYFAFMCARWAVLFFWEAGSTPESTLDALLRVERWKVTHGDCMARLCIKMARKKDV